MKDDFDKFMENNIDINQYIQYDESGHRRLYFNKSKFIEDALEYIQNDNVDCEVISGYNGRKSKWELERDKQDVLRKKAKKHLTQDQLIAIENT